ncbi:uncharacterized protein LOC118488912 [Helianthus annuus]|uniref:uncharacterized protein LOC118488912 n=1 Tax=Helianthus annuus TaxID=4232 RepID=UPI001652FEA7|nr:uncharacterized protein LOC118488912 [Helianthus annuus]
MNPEIDSDDDFEDPISTLEKVNKNRKRRTVEESSEEDDFVKPLSKKKKDDRKSKIETKKPSKKVEPPRTETRAFFEYNNKAILLRCQPNSYMDTVRKFSKKQIDEVKNMGFGAILDMNINHISTRLAYWLATNFDEMFDTLNVGRHQINITSDTVYEVFEIPKGPKQVEIIVNKRKVKKVEKIEKSKEPGNVVRDTFISQWGENTRITHGLIATAMDDQRDWGSLFKLNFLVYWMTFFPEITKVTTANDRCLLGVEAVEEIQNLDWCSYLLDTLRCTRAGWKNYKIQFVGPVAFLTLLYMHENNKRLKLFEKVVEILVIRYITSSEIDKVEEHISVNGPVWASSESENEED